MIRSRKSSFVTVVLMLFIALMHLAVPAVLIVYMGRTALVWIVVSFFVVCWATAIAKQCGYKRGNPSWQGIRLHMNTLSLVAIPLAFSLVNLASENGQVDVYGFSKLFARNEEYLMPKLNLPRYTPEEEREFFHKGNAMLAAIFYFIKSLFKFIFSLHGLASIATTAVLYLPFYFCFPLPTPDEEQELKAVLEQSSKLSEFITILILLSFLVASGLWIYS